MKKIKVNIEWCEQNYVAALEDEQVQGAVVATDKTLEGVKQSFADALAFHIEGMVADGDEPPHWLVEGQYTLEWALPI